MVVKMLFWIIYEILLILSLWLFILRVRAVWRILTKLEKEYALAPEALTAGHSVQKTRAEIRPALMKCRTEFFSWLAVTAVTGYVVLDCFVFNILR